MLQYSSASRLTVGLGEIEVDAGSGKLNWRTDRGEEAICISLYIAALQLCSINSANSRTWSFKPRRSDRWKTRLLPAPLTQLFCF